MQANTCMDFPTLRLHLLAILHDVTSRKVVNSDSGSYREGHRTAPTATTTRISEPEGCPMLLGQGDLRV